MKGVLFNENFKGDFSLKLNMGKNVTCELLALRFCDFRNLSYTAK